MKLDCGHEPSPHAEFTTGYGIMNNKKYCYDCCAKTDREDMENSGRATLYLTKKDVNGSISWEVKNWPGSLKFKAYVKKGSHNIARTRYDAWFTVNDKRWHGVQYGENTQIIHCKRVK